MLIRFDEFWLDLIKIDMLINICIIVNVVVILDSIINVHLNLICKADILCVYFALDTWVNLTKIM